MIALIDGDILAYRCAASCEPTKKKLEREPLEEAIYRLDQLTYSILSDTQAERYRIFLSGTDNFRYRIYPDYKANRKSLPRPQWLEPCREFLVREFRAEVTEGYEADDGIGIAANEYTIICTIDKDLNQVAGQHYNFVTKTFFTLDDYEAALSFWMALLQGDRADGISGVGGMGKVKAYKALFGLDPKEMESTVLRHYEGRKSEYLVNFSLLKVLRSEAEYSRLLDEINQGKFSQGKGSESTESCRSEDTGEVPGPNQ